MESNDQLAVLVEKLLHVFQPGNKKISGKPHPLITLDHTFP
jgi:hypothetical protein